MLHKLPVVLRPNIAFPTHDPEDETTIFPAFQKLVNLFWIFDQSHAFDILQENDVDVFRIGGAEATNTTQLDRLQSQLQEIPISDDLTNDIQKADIAVTRQWMRAILWRASRNHELVSAGSDPVTFCSHPFQIAKDFLEATSNIPSSAMEAHGLCAELKIFEIATSVTDAISSAARVQSWASMNRPRELLNRLHQILSSTRGGNQHLVRMLRNQIAHITSAAPVQTLVEPSSRVIEEVDDGWEEGSPEVRQTIPMDEPEFAFGVTNQIMQFDHQRSFSDSDLPHPDFGHRDSSGTSQTEPHSHMPLVSLQQQHMAPFSAPIQWDVSQTGIATYNNNDIYTPGYMNGVYGQLHVDSFAEIDMTNYTNNNDLWEEGVANGFLDVLPTHEGVKGWQ